MPTYEYECKGCRHRFELSQAMTAHPLRKCPRCGKIKLRRLIGAGAGLIFKGSGFYSTDYRKPGYKARADADKPAAPSKPAAKDGPAKPGK